jgi:hypothetical protein
MGAWRDLDNGPSHCKSIEWAKGELFISRYITSRLLNALHNEKTRLVAGPELVAGVRHAAQTGISPCDGVYMSSAVQTIKYNAKTPVVNIADLTPTQLSSKLFPRQMYQHFHSYMQCCYT